MAKKNLVKIKLHLDPDKKDEIIVNLLCNILRQTRINYEMMYLLCRVGLKENAESLLKKVEEQYEENQTTLSLFLSKWAPDIQIEGLEDKN